MSQIELPDESAQPLLRVIVEAIESGRIQEDAPHTFLSYSDALEQMGIAPHRYAGQQLKRHGLDALNGWTMRYEELPKIAALIVNKSTHRPSSGFAKSHDFSADDPQWEEWWRQEANRAIRFDWQPFLQPVERYRRMPEKTGASNVREEELPDYRDIVTLEPDTRGGPARIRGLRVTVGDILGWLAAGWSESKIIAEFPELTRDDIHAALAFAADREKRPARPTFAERWRGKFKLPRPDPGDARLTHLMKRYHRSDA